MSANHYESIVEKLAAIEEELRDLAYEHLTEAARAPDTDESDAAQREEKRLNQARRAIAKAINVLAPAATGDDD
jgi:superfamily II RNA helicase